MGELSTRDPSGGVARVSGVLISYALFGGVFAWMTHLIVQSALNGFACATGRLWPMHAVTIATLVFALHALWVGWTIRRQGDDMPEIRSARFLGLAAVVINVFNVVLIVVEWIPVLFIDPCAGGWV